ncbi:MAG: N-acetylmuramoyl-L-alanine amidase CwlD [Cellulosilyticaceae bacterium]
MRPNNRVMGMIIGLVSLVAVCGYLKFANTTVQTFGLSVASKVIVIDAGHGGFDPGKVGVTGVYEKDINLQIAQKLKAYLEQAGATVVMTRTSDEALGGVGGKSTKNDDMRYRKETINQSGADIMISIHQNAFTQPKVRGAQVFYYENAEASKQLAYSVQSNIKSEADPNNKRTIKSTTSYYVLKSTTMPSIIVECGFLTSPEEEKLLKSEEYQDKMAWAIYKGIIEYFEKVK